MSLPIEREAATISARPSAASHAPMDNIIIHEADTGSRFMAMVNGMVSTRLNVIPSKARSAINMWFCCNIKIISIINGINWVSMNNDSIRLRARTCL
jgi:hypothetical protein